MGLYIIMMLPDITNKQQEIVRLLYRFRFLNRIQIQTLLNNKDHRNINTWLKDLHTKQYVGRIFDNSYIKNTIPAKYFTSLNAIRYLKQSDKIDSSILKKYRQEKRRSASFIDKSIFVADIYLKLLNLPVSKGADFKFYTQQDFPIDAQIRELLPDFAYVYKTGKNLEHFVGEIFSDKMPRYAVRGRVRKYLEYFDEDEGKPTNILFICANDLTQNFIQRYVSRYPRDEGGLNANVYIATKANIIESGMEIELFKKASEV